MKLRWSPAMLVVGAAAACGASPMQQAAGTVPLVEMPIPSSAIQIADDIYMVPVGRDRDGCDLYAMRSTGRATLDTTFYRTAGGDFTTDRREASC